MRWHNITFFNYASSYDVSRNQLQMSLFSDELIDSNAPLQNKRETISIFHHCLGRSHDLIGGTVDYRNGFTQRPGHVIVLEDCSAHLVYHFVQKCP